ncbi:putative membrane protein [Synechococcus sp. PROS-9-1]|nr:putative membrane protein [Synechococcus sp. PROS-9-1]
MSISKYVFILFSLIRYPWLFSDFIINLYISCFPACLVCFSVFLGDFIAFSFFPLKFVFFVFILSFLASDFIASFNLSIIAEMFLL